MSGTSGLMSITDELRTCFVRVGFRAGAALELLGPAAHAALGRGEPVAARRALTGAPAGTRDLATLVSMFLLADACSADATAHALAPLSVADAAAAGLIEPASDGGFRAALDVRPVDTGAGSRWLVSDLDGALRPREIDREHVLGVGQSSLSLLRATPTEGVGTVLDVGTGCGVQAVMGVDHAARVTGIDISDRALGMAAAACALNRVEVELLAGSWFAPVAGRRFDRVVANPPFVVGAPNVDYTYRDSGLDLDGASELVVRGTPEHLTDGGTGVLLASWVHRSGQDWRHRVASWIPEHGVDAWVVQRDVADPALYVGTWLADGGVDQRSGAGGALAGRWLDHLESADVTGIGFGYVFLRRTDAPSDVLAEDLSHAIDDPLGPEAHAYLSRVAWLRDHDVLSATFALAPGTALQRVSVADPEGGWAPTVVRVHRAGGPAWEHEIDEFGAALLGGMRTGGLDLGELVALLEVAHDEDEHALVAGAVELVTGLVRHGLLVPDPA